MAKIPEKGTPGAKNRRPVVPSESRQLRALATTLAGLSPTDATYGETIGFIRDQLEKMAQRAEGGLHANPLVTYALLNPGGSDWSDEVSEVRYKHRKDGKWYKHEFAAGVSLCGNPDGTVTLYRRDKRPLWEEFPG